MVFKFFKPNKNDFAVKTVPLFFILVVIDGGSDFQPIGNLLTLNQK